MRRCSVKLQSKWGRFGEGSASNSSSRVVGGAKSAATAQSLNSPFSKPASSSSSSSGSVSSGFDPANLIGSMLSVFHRKGTSRDRLHEALFNQVPPLKALAEEQEKARNAPGPTMRTAQREDYFQIAWEALAECKYYVIMMALVCAFLYWDGLQLLGVSRAVAEGAQKKTQRAEGVAERPSNASDPAKSQNSTAADGSQQKQKKKVLVEHFQNGETRRHSGASQTTQTDTTLSGPIQPWKL
jgi:hypothetical protein